MSEFTVSIDEPITIINNPIVVEDEELQGSDTETDGTMYTVAMTEIIDRTLANVQFDKAFKRITCSAAKRGVVREWLFRASLIIVITTGLITYLTIKSLTFGVMLSTLFILILDLAARSPQWLYECTKGYPVPPFLWMEGKEKPISILL